MTDANELKRRMESTLNAFKNELSGLRTGRANTGLVEPLSVEVYGSYMPINQLASVSAPEPRMLTINVWDRSNVAAVEKAIMNSDLGLNPMTEGQMIRLPIPPLTEDRRKDLVKVASKYAEQAKVAIRNIRRDGMDDLKKAEKDKKISEDESRRKGEEVQKITDEFIGKVDDALKHKEQEIMKV